MTRAALAVVVTLGLIGTGEHGAALAVRSAARASVTIPFELATRHVIVQVTVNKSRPLSFILDTGASSAIVRMATATELGLKLEGSARTGGAGPGTQASSVVKDATWSLVGLEGFSQPVSLAVPLPQLPGSLGRDVDGIIGGEFIKQFVVALDYQARTIVLHDRRAFTYTGKGQTLPLDFTPDGHPIVKAAVTPLNGAPIEHRFMLDIGSGGALVLHSPFVAEHSFPGSQKTVRLIGAAGAGGSIAGQIGRVAALQIGSYTISNPITMFAADKAGAFANPALGGNIGAQIIRRFRAIFDYGRRRLILEPSPAFDEPFDRAFSGVALRAEGPDYRTFRVREVLEDSPASEAGIQTGDVITSVNGTAAASLTLSAVIEMLEKPVALELTIRRGDATITAVLTPRRLV